MAKGIRVSQAGIVIVLILITTFAYLWQRIQIIKVGYKIRESEKILIRVNEENSVVQLKISSLTNPRVIREKVEELGLRLVPPGEEQIVRVQE